MNRSDTATPAPANPVAASGQQQVQHHVERAAHRALVAHSSVAGALALLAPNGQDVAPLLAATAQRLDAFDVHLRLSARDLRDLGFELAILTHELERAHHRLCSLETYGSDSAPTGAAEAHASMLIGEAASALALAQSELVDAAQRAFAIAVAQ